MKKTCKKMQNRDKYENERQKGKKKGESETERKEECLTGQKVLKEVANLRVSDSWIQNQPARQVDRPYVT